MASNEMTTFSPPLTSQKNTYWELYERTAKAKYGENITVIKTPFYEGRVNEIDFQLSLVYKDLRPREVTRTIVDINMKEYSNHGMEAQDETVVKAGKSSSKTKGERYTFSTTKGVNFGVGGGIGAQVMGLAVAGGSLGFNAKYDKNKSETEETEQSNVEQSSFSYDQEEKITVPPGKHVKAIITTYSMKYEMIHKLKFSVKKNASIPVLYTNNIQQMCIGKWCLGPLFTPCCRSGGFVLVKDMISCLDDYNGEDEDGTVSFTQTGTLSWVGDGCSVNKEEEPLGKR